MTTTPPHMPQGMDDVHWSCIPATEKTPKHYVYAKAIEKPEQDDREYRVVRLENGLEAVLVSDRNADKSAASLEVAVGHMSDPDDMPGLAHFCEHLLFMGTQQFPEENEYAEYLTKHNGNYNAGTSSTDTNYYFSISADALEGALARFSSFFHSPLFEPSCTLRELNAVDSEHKKNLQSDFFRFYQVEKSLSKPGHPWAKFGTGDKRTLTEAARQKAIVSTSDADLDGGPVGQETRRRVIEWWSREYCASRMSLVIVGKESLDELTFYATKYFSPILNRGQDPCPMFTESPLGENETGKLIFVKSIRETREVRINFPIPYVEEDWRVESADFISHFVGHGGPGSLRGYLKSRGWLTSLISGSQSPARGFSMLSIHIGLTRDGFKHYEEVILACFKYLDMLRSSTFPRWIHDELKDLAAMEYRFMEKGSPVAHAQNIASVMKWPIPRACIISGPALLWEWDEQLVRSCLGSLTPDKSQVFVIGKNMDEIYVSGPWLSEKWYETQYLVNTLFAKEVSCRNDISELRLPPPNEFISKDFNCLRVSSVKPLLRPSLIKKTELSEVWHKRDDQFKVPKAHVFVLVQTPEANCGVRESVLTILYMELVEDSLEEYGYDANLAGFGYGFHAHHLGLQFQLIGFNDKLNVLLQRVLMKARNLIILPERLGIIKENLKRIWENSMYRQSAALSDTHGRYLLADRWYLLSEKITVLSDISVSDVKEHVERLFSQVKYKMLINGNMNKIEATRLVNIVEETLTDNPLSTENVVFDLSRILPRGCNYVWELPVPNPDEVNSAVTYFCHVGDRSDARLRIITSLLDQILSEPVFNVLRTQEQLGYIVSCDRWEGTEFIGLRICVQSQRDPKYLETRIEAFLTTMGGMLACMDEVTFEEHKGSLSRSLTDRLKNLPAETFRFWSQIESGYLDFERNLKSAAILQSISKADVLDLFKTRVDPSSTERSKLSVHMRAKVLSGSHATADDDKVELSESVVYIQDPKEFKSSLRVSGPPKPVEDFYVVPSPRL